MTTTTVLVAVHHTSNYPVALTRSLVGQQQCKMHSLLRWSGSHSRCRILLVEWTNHTTAEQRTIDRTNVRTSQPASQSASKQASQPAIKQQCDSKFHKRPAEPRTTPSTRSKFEFRTTIESNKVRKSSRPVAVRSFVRSFVCSFVRRRRVGCEL